MMKKFMELIEKLTEVEEDDGDAHLDNLVRDGLYKRGPNGTIRITKKGKKAAKEKASKIAKGIK